MKQNLRETRSRGSFLFPLERYRTEDATGNAYVSCHWHPDTEIILLRKGAFRLFLDGQLYPVTADTIVFVNREELHALNCQSDYLLYDALVFPLELLSSSQYDYCQQKYILPLIQKKLSFPAFLTPDMAGYSQVRDQFDAICQALGEEAPGYQLSVKAALFQMIASLARYGLLAASQGPESPFRARQLETMKAIVSYLEDHMGEKISLEDAAALCYMTPNYFCKYFRRQFGMTFTRYLNGLRLERACILLADTDLPVMEISLQCGFDNLSYFIRLFKKEKGMTPTDYRKRLLPA